MRCQDPESMMTCMAFIPALVCLHLDFFYGKDKTHIYLV